MMSQEPLVSIIIPTFNRAHLIGETLDSVLAQTYKNWECIVVDDGSTDETDKVMKTYCEKDSRFKYFHRPDEHLPGGNGARNYGFKMSQGEYIQWFDSDDLMIKENLEEKMRVLSNNKMKFCVSKTKNFTDSNNFITIEKYRYNSLNKLDIINFVNQNVYWLTPDFIVHRNSIEEIGFSEKLKSSQETNFFIKFLAQNINGIFLDIVLTHRRLHNNTIRKSVEVNKITSNIYKSLSLLDAYHFIFKKTTSKALVVLESHIIRSLFRAKFKISKDELIHFYNKLKKHRGKTQGIYFRCLWFFTTYNKGYYFYKKLQNYG